MMPQPSHSISTTTTLVLVLLLFIALFPDLFHSIWTLPFALIPFKTSSSTYKGSGTMSWAQKQFTLPAKSRGSYLITDHVVSSVPEIKNYKVGLLNLFVQHTSCALSLNENCRSISKLVTLHEVLSGCLLVYFLQSMTMSAQT